MSLLDLAFGDRKYTAFPATVAAQGAPGLAQSGRSDTQARDKARCIGTLRCADFTSRKSLKPSRTTTYIPEMA